MSNEIDCGVPKQEFFIYPEGHDDKEGDLLQMDTTFTPDEIIEGEDLVLSFLTFDMLTSALADRDLDLVVTVNGFEVVRRSLFDQIHGQDYIDIVEVNLTELEVPLSAQAENTVSFHLEAIGLHHQSILRFCG